MGSHPRWSARSVEGVGVVREMVVDIERIVTAPVRVERLAAWTAFLGPVCTVAGGVGVGAVKRVADELDDAGHAGHAIGVADAVELLSVQYVEVVAAEDRGLGEDIGNIA
jgi:hypothetical protein